ncbi:MAG: hypothetical protein KAR42_08200 [candidate division Zixibacteria bacterium]|nr:hypothetical protein [candidate division Zixibacteria bacterium]
MDFSPFLQILSGLKKALLWIFEYPIIIKYLNQFKTKKGYVVRFDIHTPKKRIIKIRKCDIKLTIRHNKALLKEVEKDKLLHGESTIVFDSPHILTAYLKDLSYGNVMDYLQIHEQSQTVYLLLQVKGPGNIDPSLRLQIAPVYSSIDLSIHRFILWIRYLEIPLNKLSIIGGNKKTIIK